MKGEIILSKKEVNRLEILQKVINKRLKIIESARLLNLSYRHTKRLVKKIREKGTVGLIHGNRGMPSKRKISNEMINKIIDLIEKKYHDFGPTFANEKLLENHNIKISTEKLRQILIDKNIWIPNLRKDRDGHFWRDRKDFFGEMVQFDGSHHRWLEDRLDQEFCLLCYIDDAVSNVWGKFYGYEGIFPGFDSLIEYSKKYGFPHSIYEDMHSTYKTTREANIDEELRGEQADTQYQRVLKEIGIKQIFARSPQAKGRVERVFKTLQDRLVKEMRLKNISTIEEANEFLKTFWPKFNEKFSIEAKKKGSLFKTVPKDFDYKWTFAIQDKRTIGNDFTIRFKNRLFLLNNHSITLKKKRVLIKIALDGEIRIISKNNILSFKEITDSDYKLAKIQQKEMIKILSLKSNSDKKSKKSWMDDFYLGQNSINFKNEFNKNNIKELVKNKA